MLQDPTKIGDRQKDFQWLAAESRVYICIYQYDADIYIRQFNDS